MKKRMARLLRRAADRLDPVRPHGMEAYFGVTTTTANIDIDPPRFHWQSPGWRR